MTLAGQRISTDRYQVIPRTLVFITKGSEILLLRIPADRGAWGGRLNGIGGHIERGEDPLSSARREVREETGLHSVALRMVGVIMVDTGREPGIGLYVFVGQVESSETISGPEGDLMWVGLESLSEQPLVDDLPTLVPRALQSASDGTFFSGMYTYDLDGELDIHFSE
jgi:8-oxo-dGTP diphosphatase